MTTLNVKKRQSLELEQTTLFSLRKQNQNQSLTKTNRNDPERFKLAMNRNLEPQKVLPMF
jgi:hypothetical protein